MTTADRGLLRLRLRNQRLTGTALGNPAEIVAWLGAVQAQDYTAAKWGLGLRANGVADADVERAFNEGAILRTHVLRPTWHFVTPADIRWILALTAPRVHAVNAYWYRKFELDARTFTRSGSVFERALRDGNQLTRPELAAVLERSGIRADGLRLAYLMMHAELDQVICSGRRRGRQFSYALFEERVPRTKQVSRDEALAELTRRYFSSHGPATVRDFVWWSSLTIREAKTGLAMLGPALAQKVVGDRTCWFAVPSPPTPRASSSAHLLPIYDEYLIAYKDRGAVVHLTAKDLFAHYVVVDGRLAGTWKRTERGEGVVVEAAPYMRLTDNDARALRAAAGRLGRFVNKAATLTMR